jgi:hypothetical protein
VQSQSKQKTKQSTRKSSKSAPPKPQQKTAVMKIKTTINRWMPSAIAGLGMAAFMLISTGTASAQVTPDLTIQTFDSGISGVGNWWGSGIYAYDATQDATGNGGGSLHITVPNDTSSDTPLNPYICINGGNPWYNAGVVNLALYKSVEFDVKWDNTSILTIDQFNSQVWPAAFGPDTQGGDPYGRSFNIRGVNPVNASNVSLGSTNIPNTASNGWVHVSFPIDPSIAGISTISGITFEKWNANSGAIVSNGVASPTGFPFAKFWVDNLVLKGTAGPPPPPTVNPLAKPVKGMNIIYGSSGAYDRHEARLWADTGKSWVGNATPANPVTYSFTINGFAPNAVANTSGCEAYLFVVPNPAAHDNAPDWNEPNCLVASIQQGLTNAILTLQYKVNNPNNNAMYGGGSRGWTDTTTTPGVTAAVTEYYNAPVGSLPGGATTNTVVVDTTHTVVSITNETGNLGTVTNTATSPTGTWSIQFTSDSAGTLQAPDGSTSSFIIPSYNAAIFAETPGATTNTSDIYLGGQPNNAVALNAAVVYSAFSVSGTPNPFSENFLTETALNTTNWDTSPSSAPAAFVVPASAAYWVNWTLPNGGFGLQISTNVTGLQYGTSPSKGPVLGLNGITQQLVDSSELPASKTAFFGLLKRQFTQLQVLLPGQTNAPGTTLGYTGTPTPISLTTQGLTTTTVTVNAVDSTFHIVSGSFDQIHLTSSDTGAALPNDQALSNGTATFVDPNGVLFGTTGSQTVTATDTINTNIPAAISAPVTITN